MNDTDMLRAAAREGAQSAEALDALAAWLLAEDAYPRGGVPDEVLTYLQDRIDTLLGPHATEAAGEFLRRRAGTRGDQAVLARDRSALIDLLAMIEGKRRPGFEFEWRTFPGDGQPRRPENLLVMGEYGSQDPAWDRPRGTGDPVDLSELGVSDGLVRRLRAWNDEFGQEAGDDSGWAERGLALARELQRELPDIDIRYYHGDDDRPLRAV